MALLNPMMGGVTPPAKKSGMLWAIIALLIVALLAAAWFYYYGSVSGPQGTSAPGAGDAATTELQTQGSSDDIAAIESDLNATDLGGLDAELGDIEAELAK